MMGTTNNYYSTTLGPTLSGVKKEEDYTIIIPTPFCTNLGMQKKKKKHSLQTLSSMSLMKNSMNMMTRRDYHVSSIQYQESNTKDTQSNNNNNNQNTNDATNNNQQEQEQKLDIPKFADRPEDCPEFENPLHFSDPEKMKVFIDEFPEGEAPIRRLPPLSGANSPHIRELANDILHLNMLELNELVSMVKAHFGFEDLDMGMMGGVAGGGGSGATNAADAAPPVVEEKTIFDLKLTGFDDKSKIKVIKEIRTITGLGLKEAKELVEGVPKTVKKGIKKEDAEELKVKLEAVGATVVIE
jgi:large subunit ribosomal protein L7/L12